MVCSSSVPSLPSVQNNSALSVLCVSFFVPFVRTSDTPPAVTNQTSPPQTHLAAAPSPTSTSTAAQYPSPRRIARRKNGNAPACSGRTASGSDPASPAAPARTAPAHSGNYKPSRTKSPASASSPAQKSRPPSDDRNSPPPPQTPPASAASYEIRPTPANARDSP
jgi:hypothetical protein